MFLKRLKAWRQSRRGRIDLNHIEYELLTGQEVPEWLISPMSKREALERADARLKEYARRQRELARAERIVARIREKLALNIDTHKELVVYPRGERPNWLEERWVLEVMTLAPWVVGLAILVFLHWVSK